MTEQGERSDTYLAYVLLCVENFESFNNSVLLSLSTHRTNLQMCVRQVSVAPVFHFQPNSGPFKKLCAIFISMSVDVRDKKCQIGSFQHSHITKNSLINKLETHITMYKSWNRYINIFCIVKVEHLDDSLKLLNIQDKKINFTMVIENNNCLPFLDLNIMKNNNQVRIWNFQKRY